MNKEQSENQRPGLRMKELTEATGLPKSTILHYLDQGLLPPPVKTSPNMAYYDPACVERLVFIRDLQSRLRLPLSKIRHALELREGGQEMAMQLELMEGIFGVESGVTLNRDELCRQSGLTPEQLDQLEKAQLMLPMEDGRYDAEDLAAAQVLAQGLERGITVEDMSFYPRLGKEIVDREMAARHRLTGHLPPEQDAELSLRMLQSARTLRRYVIDRLFMHRVARSADLKDEGMLR